jgi:hypothetical protein
VPFTQELPPDLARAINAVVIIENPLDLGAQSSISADTIRCSLRALATAGVLIIGRRGDRQHIADRLDPER